jgi:hypothetical protein
MTTDKNTDIPTLERRLNDAILEGRALEIFDELYADECVMSENGGEVTHGKEANRKREEDFFGSIAEVHEISLHGSAAQGEVSFSEWVFDVTFADGQRKRLEQVAVRRWRDGKVVEERFYYDPS